MAPLDDVPPTLPAPRHPSSGATGPTGHARGLDALDGPSALVADLDAIAARAHLTSSEEARRHAQLAAHADVWLGVVGTLERLRVLPPRLRPAYLRGAQLWWRRAAEELGEQRYGAIGARLARWRAGEPRLVTVKELLWALEQVEAIGGTRMAYVGLTALGTLVPPMSRRYGYVIAQSGRPIRTLGDSDGAIERYSLGATIGRRLSDQWLHARSILGAGSTSVERGNYPAARGAFHKVLRLIGPHSELAYAAHQGLTRCAIAAKNYPLAFRHGWQAFRGRKTNAFNRAVALGTLAGLCRRVGRYHAALRAAKAAIALSSVERIRIENVRIALQAAVALRDLEDVARYAALLARDQDTITSLYDRSWASIVLAQAYDLLGEHARSEQYLDKAARSTREHRFHELEFEVEQFRDAGKASPSQKRTGARTNPEPLALDTGTRRLIDEIDALPLDEAELLAVR